MRMNYDFVAPEGTHFGIVKSIAERLAEIPNPVDYWDATPTSVTVTNGRVSTWTGALGRQFVQATEARRPVYTGNGLRLSNADGNAAEAMMSLGGAQIGAQTALTIACKVRLAAGALNTDGQYFWGCQSPIHRVFYRYTNGNNYIRSQVVTAINNIDRDVPATQADFGAVWVANGTDYTLHVVGGGSASFAAAESVNLASLFLGAAASTSPSVIGWMRRMGAWLHAPTAAELEALLGWVA